MNYTDNELKNMLLDDLHEYPMSFGNSCERIAENHGLGRSSRLFKSLWRIKKYMKYETKEIRYDGETGDCFYIYSENGFWGSLAQPDEVIVTPTLQED